MPIQVGERLPQVTFRVMTPDGPVAKTTDDLFKGRKVVLVAVPGAFTPTCHRNHLPGYVQKKDEIKAKGIDSILVTSVNDVFVLEAWAQGRRGGGNRVPVRRQWRFRQGDRPVHGRLGLWPRHALAALFHGRRERRGEGGQCGGRSLQGAAFRRRKPEGSLLECRIPARSACAGDRLRRARRSRIEMATAP